MGRQKSKRTPAKPKMNGKAKITTLPKVAELPTLPDDRSYLDNINVNDLKRLGVDPGRELTVEEKLTRIIFGKNDEITRLRIDVSNLQSEVAALHKRIAELTIQKSTLETKNLAQETAQSARSLGMVLGQPVLERDGKPCFAARQAPEDLPNWNPPTK